MDKARDVNPREMVVMKDPLMGRDDQSSDKKSIVVSSDVRTQYTPL